MLRTLPGVETRTPACPGGVLDQHLASTRWSGFALKGYAGTNNDLNRKLRSLFGGPPGTRTRRETAARRRGRNGRVGDGRPTTIRREAAPEGRETSRRETAASGCCRKGRVDGGRPTTTRWIRLPGTRATRDHRIKSQTDGLSTTTTANRVQQTPTGNPLSFNRLIDIRFTGDSWFELRPVEPECPISVPRASRPRTPPAAPGSAGGRGQGWCQSSAIPPRSKGFAR
jgi:hypothetical protein